MSGALMMLKAMGFDPAELQRMGETFAARFEELELRISYLYHREKSREQAQEQTAKAIAEMHSMMTTIERELHERNNRDDGNAGGTGRRDGNGSPGE